MKLTSVAAIALSAMAITAAIDAQASAPAITLQKILVINVKTSDLQRSAKFYSEVFGYRIARMVVQSPQGSSLAKSLDEKGVHWVLMDGVFPLVLVTNPGPTSPRFDGLVPSFQVADLDATFATVQRLGLTVLKPIQRIGGPKDFGFFIIADPDGNPLDIMQLTQGSKSVFDEPVEAAHAQKPTKNP